MRVAAVAVVGCLAACGDAEPGSPLVGASCVLEDDNALRLLCRVDRASPGPVTVTVRDAAPDSVPRVVSGWGTSVDLVVWGLHADVDATWVATVDDGVDREISGVVRTGSLPDPLSVPPFLLSPGGATVDAVLLPYGCEGFDNLAMIDRDGHLIWYEDFGAYLSEPAGFNGHSLTADGVIAVMGREAVVEVGFDGIPRRVLQGGDLLHIAHHDAIRSGDLTYVISAALGTFDDGSTFVQDGVDVYDSGGWLASWQLGAPFALQDAPAIEVGYWAGMFQDAFDASHANGLALDASDRLLVSLRHLDTVIALDGVDHGTPSLAWVLNGRPNDAVPADLALDWTNDGAFELQHHPMPQPDGTITLFDNGQGSSSRGLQVAVDPDAGTATEVASWPIDPACLVQGAFTRLPSGNGVLACATARRVIEVDPAGTLVWQMTPTCGAMPLGSGFARALPVSLQ
jgi:hypothetical protein